MGFFRDCKAELMEGLRDNPIHAAKEVRHGTGIGVKPLQEKTLEQKLQEQEENIRMLTECLLEMSEAVYA